ncbi:hypothetical protein UAY_00177 [Enterococcus moraviensis ATCC BAA-383]|uniref:Uncharacterized protein n=1 Tax=Enterococcus moraviensis ATCC BAA-383 TaxID=1158609 RepID=R2RCS8_9ENTE|nr:hypothetical protein [Enterococcus moraviensis]EOI06835.1 hypothetical protein UAY_00177 [Enterococcus moraviensis ATCC BAA-383]EOT65178.1 hypothetical protein I586_02912 [Enterococcus moraviensis ATCC BAA-383]OJG66560.1 hypothetical protein RV09_GL000913 [Enterococcus moraviensis]
MAGLQTDRNQYFYSEDIQGQQYQAIVRLALEQKCTFFEFCIRHDIDFKGDNTYSYHKKAYELISELNSFLITKIETNSWATSMVIAREKVVEVYRFELNSDSLSILLNYSKSIGDWQGPNLPEDITFFQDEKMWLGTVGHEKMSWWFLTDTECQEVRDRGIALFGGM